MSIICKNFFGIFRSAAHCSFLPASTRLVPSFVSNWAKCLFWGQLSCSALGRTVRVCTILCVQKQHTNVWLLHVTMADSSMGDVSGVSLVLYYWDPILSVWPGALQTLIDGFRNEWNFQNCKWVQQGHGILCLFDDLLWVTTGAQRQAGSSQMSLMLVVNKFDIICVVGRLYVCLIACS